MLQQYALILDPNMWLSFYIGRLVEHLVQQKQKSVLRKSRSSSVMNENNLTSPEVQQVRIWWGYKILYKS
jgi:hypothetical protein